MPTHFLACETTFFASGSNVPSLLLLLGSALVWSKGGAFIKPLTVWGGVLFGAYFGAATSSQIFHSHLGDGPTIPIGLMIGAAGGGLAAWMLFRLLTTLATVASLGFVAGIASLALMSHLQVGLPHPMLAVDVVTSTPMPSSTEAQAYQQAADEALRALQDGKGFEAAASPMLQTDPRPALVAAEHLQAGTMGWLNHFTPENRSQLIGSVIVGAVVGLMLATFTPTKAAATVCGLIGSLGMMAAVGSTTPLATSPVAELVDSHFMALTGAWLALSGVGIFLQTRERGEGAKQARTRCRDKGQNDNSVTPPHAAGAGVDSRVEASSNQAQA